MVRLKSILIFLIVLIPFISIAQNIAATYAIENTISMGGKTITVDLKGHYFKKGNKYIFWEEPLYLTKYPKGVIEIAMDKSIYSSKLNMDTMQMLFYYDFDSLIMRAGLISPMQHNISEFPFEGDFSRPWILETKTKTINGMKCQLATLPDEWSVWFCPDIPAKTSLTGLQGIPGLIVEADFIPAHEHYTLLTYNTPATIDDKIFMPDVFKQPMIKGPLIKHNKAPAGKTKAEKQQDLINQNN